MSQNQRFGETEVHEIGDVVLVEMRRPPVNSLGWSLRDSIDQVFTHLARDEAVGAVVLTGEHCFSAGVDVGELHADSPDNAAQRNALYQYCFSKISLCPHPVIAALDGYALGGGLELAMHCDLRVATSTAKLGLPEVKLGGVPGIGGMQRLARLVGEGRAKHLTLAGETVSGARAYEIGLVDLVVDGDSCRKEAVELATTIADNPRPAVRGIKRAISLGRDLPLEKAQVLDLEYVAAVAGTPERLDRLRDWVDSRRKTARTKNGTSGE